MTVWTKLLEQVKQARSKPGDSEKAQKLSKLVDDVKANKVSESVALNVARSRGLVRTARERRKFLLQLRGS